MWSAEKRPTAKFTVQVTPWMENARDFDPPDPRMNDIAKKDDGFNEHSDA